MSRDAVRWRVASGRSAKPTPTIEQLGTFDLENYGDLLYPLVFERILKARDARLRLHPYSFLNGDAPQEAGFVTHPIQSLFAPERNAPSTIVIGGGDILRTDWVVAGYYRHVYRDYCGRLWRLLGAADLARYLLRRGFRRVEEESFFASRFRARWMNYPAIGPFLINPDDLTKGSTIAYLSCGVPHDFAPADRDAVKRTFDRTQFIYLRDEQSAEKLRRAGVRREIHVAPDLIVTLSEQFERAVEACKGREILSSFGVDVERPVLCFQSNPFSGFCEAEIIEELKRYRQRTRAEVVLLPLGFCHGDHKFLQRLSKKSGDTLKYIGVYSIFDMISVIAACELFVGTSLHGNITAFSYGIPHLIGPLRVDKAEGFLRVANLPPELKLGSWRELNDKIDMIEELGQAFFSVRSEKARLRVHQVANELIDALLRGEDS